MDRQLRGVKQVLQDDAVAGLFDHFQADESLGRVADDTALGGRDPLGLQRDDVEPADVHRHHRAREFVFLFQASDVEGPLRAVDLVFRREQQQVLFGVKLHDRTRADVVLGRPLFGQRDRVRRSTCDLDLARLHSRREQPTANKLWHIYVVRHTNMYILIYLPTFGWDDARSVTYMYVELCRILHFTGKNIS